MLRTALCIVLKVGALVMAVLTTACIREVQPTASSCRGLAELALPDATITLAEEVNAGEFMAPDDGLSRLMSLPGMDVAGHTTDDVNPAFCRVAATLTPTSDSSIKIEVWLPLARWNGKFLGVGNFGWGGSLMYGGMLSALVEGYAAASTDTGHDASTPEGQGGLFAYGHPEKLIDYAYRADHLMTVRAKAIIKAYYGTAVARSYWIGCSLGGLEGLIEAKRYPEDYDGIVVGAPPNPLVHFNAAQLWPSWLVARDPSALISSEQYTLIHDTVLEECAGPAEKPLGFIAEPDQCSFDPAQLLCADSSAQGCLTAPQVQLMRQIYGGPVNPRTQESIFPGPARGSETGLDGFANGTPFSTALDLFRYAAFQDPNWDWSALDWDQVIEQATAKVGPLLHVDSDLTAFMHRGGKLLLYIGWNDYHNPEELAHYYESVVSRVGSDARDAVRLFLIPGMGHCFGGAGCDTFDKLGTIDGWVSEGRVPARLVASHVADDGMVQRTRPLCAYPEVASYRGAGPIEEADSYTCSPAGMSAP